MKLWVTSYGSPDFYISLDVLRMSAYMHGHADQVILWTEMDGDLSNSLTFKHFKDQHTNLFAGSGLNVKGKGYYSLKAYVISKTLEKMHEGDILLYCDSTCLIMQSLRSIKQLFTHDSQMAFFSLCGGTYPNLEWTKPRLFNIMYGRTDFSQLQNVQQLNAAVQLYIKGAQSTEFVDEYMRWSGDIDAMTEDGFTNHRHDQSILTNLAYSWRKSPPISIHPDCLTQHGVKQTHVTIHHHRLMLTDKQIMKLDIITPTIVRNQQQLIQCMKSVQDQTGIPPGIRVEHWVVVDGPIKTDINTVVNSLDYKAKIPIRILHLPVNTGAGGWNGHRIYAAMSFLSDGTHISFLDEDNWLEPGHISSMVHVLQTSTPPLDGVFCLRKICDFEGRYICDDLCESLGSHRHSVMHAQDFFCDTSCLLISKHLAADVANLWNVPARPEQRGMAGKAEADRAISQVLLRQRKFKGTRRATLNYRLGGSVQSVNADFFKQGNQIKPQWKAQLRDVYIFHFGPEQTENLFKHRGECDLKSALLEWQPTLLNGVEDCNLLDGYKHVDVIPPHSIVYASLCFPQQLPLEQVFKRTDVFRVVYTVESPNLAHSGQWQMQFLKSHFDVWLTYWEPLIKQPQSVLCYHNTHHLTPVGGSLRHLLMTNKGTADSVCIVLANRPGCQSYCIDNQVLMQLDHLRGIIASGLNIAAYGKDWHRVAEKHPNVKVMNDAGKFDDTRSSVEIMNDYAFTVIVENCDAESYVSEKMYDAFIAGSIPLYYGNVGRVPIPKDMYIDMRNANLNSAGDMQKLLTDVDVSKMRNAIYNHRERVLLNVSTDAFASAFGKALEKYPF